MGIQQVNVGLLVWKTLAPEKLKGNGTGDGSNCTAPLSIQHDMGRQAEAAALPEMQVWACGKGDANRPIT